MTNNYSYLLFPYLLLLMTVGTHGCNEFIRIVFCHKPAIATDYGSDALLRFISASHYNSYQSIVRDGTCQLFAIGSINYLFAVLSFNYLRMGLMGSHLSVIRNDEILLLRESILLS